MIEKKWVRVLIQVLIVVLVLLGLILTGVRLLLTDAFVRIEYNMPYFPEDPYGMTKEERLTYAPIAVEYLLNDEDISFLGDLTFDDGSVLYNERELSHMVDVKVLTGKFLNIWVGVLFGLVLVMIIAWRGNWLQDFRGMVSRAGMIVIIVLGTLVLFMLLSFNAIFTGFHRIFFEGDTWLFLFSDTLIRLFPLQFWQDAFIAVGVFTLLGGLGLWLGLGRRKSKKE